MRATTASGSGTTKSGEVSHVQPYRYASSRLVETLVRNTATPTTPATPTSAPRAADRAGTPRRSAPDATAIVTPTVAAGPARRTARPAGTASAQRPEPAGASRAVDSDRRPRNAREHRRGDRQTTAPEHENVDIETRRDLGSASDRYREQRRQCRRGEQSARRAGDDGERARCGDRERPLPALHPEPAHRRVGAPRHRELPVDGEGDRQHTGDRGDQGGDQQPGRQRPMGAADLAGVGPLDPLHPHFGTSSPTSSRTNASTSASSTTDRSTRSP